jgi:glycerophosphoryl diester phosphodiesterase
LFNTVKIIEDYTSKNLLKLPNYNIEIKSKPVTDSVFHPGVQEFSDIVLSLIDSLDIKDRVTIQSFDFRILKYLNKEYPNIKLSVLVSENFNPIKNIADLGFRPDVFSPNYKYLKKNDIKYLKDKKIKIIPWTVNSYSDIAKLLRLDVDGIITDYPDRVLKIIN